MKNDLNLVKLIVENEAKMKNEKYFKTPKIFNSEFNTGISPGDVATQMGFKEISQYLGKYSYAKSMLYP